jgi:hypothetical protein
MEEPPVRQFLKRAAVGRLRLAVDQHVEIEVAMALGLPAGVAAVAKDGNRTRLGLAQAGGPGGEKLIIVHVHHVALYAR